MRVSIFFMVMISLTSLAICQDLLAPGETWTYNANYTVKESDLCSCIANNATANAVGPCSEAENSAGPVTVETAYDAKIYLEKISDKTGEKVDAGDTVTYTYYVTNTGDVNLSEVSLEDDLIAITRYLSGDDNRDDLLNPEEVWVYEGAYIVDESDLCHKIVNFAVARGLDPCNREISGNATAEVETLCTICCQEGENQDLINLGDQRAVGLHSSQAKNKVKIETDQTL